MESNNKGYIKIPYAALTIIAMILIGFGTWGITVASNKNSQTNQAASVYKQVEVNTKAINEEIKPDIQRLKDGKVDKDQFDKLYDLCLKINDKLDAHMARK
jgi:hypothetical protein